MVQDDQPYSKRQVPSFNFSQINQRCELHKNSGRPVDKTLQNTFGLQGFREGQERVIGALLDGRSALAIFPTGGGKSLCYQLPALHLDGLTLVVSPLIALMKDQLDALGKLGVPAARLDSSLEADEARKVYEDLRSGRLKLLYIAPERLANERFLNFLERLPIALLAIDEAHCISEWGHNFRPDYLRLARLAKALKVGRVLALTATATPEVAQDIAQAFEIAETDIVRTDFHRPNLDLRVTACTLDHRPEILIDRLRKRPRGPTIVYVTLQRTAENVATLLANEGFPAEAYHAGMESEVRHAVQERFMTSSDAIVVATIAFGMGIDKANIRYVYHYNLPGGLENYVQEIGRAGRDGLASTCELLACADDLIVLENFTYGDTPTPESVAGLLNNILGQEKRFSVSVSDLSGTYDIRPLVIETFLTYLELDGVIEPTGPFYNEYAFQPLRSSQAILERFDSNRAKFLRGMFRQARKGKTWFKLDADETAEKLNEPRTRIVNALNYLEEQGELIVRTTGARLGFRKVQPVENQKELLQSLIDRFQGHEARNLIRRRQVLNYVEHHGCRTRYLLEYFGEDAMESCGHCGACLGDKIGPLPRPADWRPGPDDGRQLLALEAEGHLALKSHRQMARFLCGLSSPASSRAKLNRHPDFGQLSAVPFGKVLEFLEQQKS